METNWTVATPPVGNHSKWPQEDNRDSSMEKQAPVKEHLALHLP